jgi:hypothetical protein
VRRQIHSPEVAESRLLTVNPIVSTGIEPEMNRSAHARGFGIAFALLLSSLAADHLMEAGGDSASGPWMLSQIAFAKPRRESFFNAGPFFPAEV